MFKLLKQLVAVSAALTAFGAKADLIDGEELLDPTRPLFVSSNDSSDSSDVMAMIRNVVPSSYDLSFIRAGSSPIAIINQERVRVGDVIGGATVTEIERNSVTLTINGEEQRISLYGNGIKVPATQ